MIGIRASDNGTNSPPKKATTFGSVGLAPIAAGWLAGFWVSIGGQYTSLNDAREACHHYEYVKDIKKSPHQQGRARERAAPNQPDEEDGGREGIDCRWKRGH